MCCILAYSSQKFTLKDALLDTNVPKNHQKAILTKLEQLSIIEYRHVIPQPKIDFVKSLGTIHDHTPLYELRCHAANKAQYRLPFVAQHPPDILLLGFFKRKDANFEKEIATAEQRFIEILTGQAPYEKIDLQHIANL